MTDLYDEMRVPPDRAQAEALRQRLHARMASVSGDDHERRSQLHLDTAGVEPEQFVPIKEIAVTVDLPTRETRDRRRPVFAVAAVVAIIGAAAIAFAVNNTSSGDDEPSPSATAATMETVRFAVDTANGIPVTFTVPDHWTVLDGWSAYKDLGTGVLFAGIANIYTDGCRWVLLDPPVGPSVDDLVAAWAAVPDLAATAPVDITVDGYAGKQIEFTVPGYTAGECRGNNQFGLYRTSDARGDVPAYWAQGPNQHNQMWVLDVDGTRLVIGAAYLPSTSPQDRAALDQVLASIQIG